ncbi:MAG TPA: hypothetical protein VGB24_15885 [Longimicrobium sp.]|jgi:hypothetical protein|uniref:hypothetical protein n=1 Tax=Longimicrobium sp. TaxID=2029185 RepID=UPI002ED9BC9F
METTAAIPGLRACPACGTMSATRFCGDCGRAVDGTPARTVEVLKEGASELFGVDRSALRTIRDLLLHPLKVAQSVRGDNEEGYVRPFRLFFLLAGAYILLLTTVQPHSFELSSQATPEQLATMAKVAAGHGISPEMMNARFGQRMNMLLPLISAVMLIPLGALLRRMDRSRPVGDHMLMMASVTNSLWITCILLIPVAFLGKWPFMIAAQLAGIGYISAAIIRLYPGATRVRTGLRLVGFLLAYYTLTMLLSIALSLGVMISVLRF